MHRIPSLALNLLPLAIRPALATARGLGARAVTFTADWVGGFERPGVIPVAELEGRTLQDFRRAVRHADLTVAALDLPDLLTGGEGLDRIYALGARGIELLAALDGPTGVLSVEVGAAAAAAVHPSAGGDAAAAATVRSALHELVGFGLNRGVRVAVRSSGPWVASLGPGGAAGPAGLSAPGALDGLTVDLDLPQARRFGARLAPLIEASRGRIVHLRCDDQDLRLRPAARQGLWLPQRVEKPEPESLDELTIFLEHAGYEGAWTLAATPPAPAGATGLQALAAALERLRI
ncbi:MAG: hypothetical protein ACREJ2_07305 [Planctomycetota bacterium]